MTKYLPSIITAIISLICTGCKDDSAVELVPVLAENAMIVTAHPEATKVGIEILQNGGNAIDAAVAVQLALAVVYPAAGNIGGGGLMVGRHADGTIYALDYREVAPALAHRDMYLDSLNEVIDGLSITGHLGAGVPGSVAGIYAAWDSLGSMPWATLVQPALDLTRNGFTLTEKEARGLNNQLESIREASTQPPSWLGVAPDWKVGDTIKMPDLATTLELIRDHGRDGFYKGPTANKIIEEMERGKGLISLKDLSNYKAVWRAPVVGKFKNIKVISMPPPSSGGVALIQLLTMLEPYDLKSLGQNTPGYIHLVSESERRVYADRAHYLGDPDYVEIPVEALINDEYLLNRMKEFNPEKATNSKAITHGDVMLFVESMETTHLSIVDAEGNAVSVTTTLNGSYGSKVMVGGAGFLLNNEMDDFSIKPGAPNMFGLVGGEANQIAPGKRMLSSMTPTILEKNGSLLMVTGTPGGSTIITSVLQSILNVVIFEMNIQEAVSAPRFHHQWLPDLITMEEALDAKDRTEILKAKGHEIKFRKAIGRVDAIRKRTDGWLEGGADHRGDDTALGF